MDWQIGGKGRLSIYGASSFLCFHGKNSLETTRCVYKWIFPRETAQDPWNPCQVIDTNSDRNLWDEGARLDTNQTDLARNYQNVRYGIWTDLAEDWEARYQIRHVWLAVVSICLTLLVFVVQMLYCKLLSCKTAAKNGRHEPADVTSNIAALSWIILQPKTLGL